MKWKFEAKFWRVHDKINIILERRNIAQDKQIKRKEGWLTKATYLVEKVSLQLDKHNFLS